MRNVKSFSKDSVSIGLLIWYTGKKESSFRAAEVFMDMKILNLIGGGDVGGAKTHIISLASRLGYSCTVKIVSFRDGPFVEDTRAAGIDVEVVHNRTARADLKALECIVSEYKPDIIHCHGARANMMGVLLRRKVHLPLVTTIHSDYKLDYMGMPLKGMTFGLINRFCLRRIDYYTCVARRTARMMISRGFPAHHIFTIYNGIDFSTFRTLVDKREYLARFGQTYRDGDVLCGFAARLTAVKDVPTLLRAAAKACKQCPNLKIVIAGDGEDRQSLEALTASLGIRENVIFLGWIDDIHSFFAAMDINVICSLSETFPYSILEGIQERCATVTSDVGGMPELIDSGVNGFIFPPGDDAALARHLVTLCESEELRKTFSDRLFDKASAHFSLDSMAKKLRAERFKGGAVKFDSEELHFDVDEKGKPIRCYYKRSKDANKLIEEFMLLANRTVAESIGRVKKGQKAKTLPYRVHDNPDPQKLETLKEFIVKFGYRLKTEGSKSAIARSLNSLMDECEGTGEQKVIQKVALRAMMKAKYSVHNIGHFGLAFDYYTHFTSPIRRYPDTMVHRLLTRYLLGGRSANERYYEELCEHSSDMEQIAQNAERDSIKYKMVEFMGEHVGEEYDAHISGIQSYGIYCEIDENHCEGLVPMHDLDDDFYDFDEKNFCLVGRRRHHKYQLGDAIRIKVAQANIERKQLDFVIV